MAISTASKNLSDFYAQKIELDRQQLSQLKIITEDGYDFRTGAGETEGIKIWSVTELIDSFNSIIKPLDSEVVSINSQISSLQNQILTLGQEANSVGCGGTWSISPGYVGVVSVTVYQDILNYKGYQFSGINPFEEINGTITSGNIGVGTYNFVTQVSIGTYFGPINSCNPEFPLFFLCDNEECENYANTIINLNSQIVALQSTRDNLNVNINILKSQRISQQLQNYAYSNSKQNIEQSIQYSENVINFLQNY